MLLKVGHVVFLALLINVSVKGTEVTLNQLRARPNLTPEQFAASFRDFQFVFHAEIQDPEVFLSTKSGDCDDYATLAATVLREKGYTPRLIAIRMPGIVHVVCYIEETHSYLDYNKRHSHCSVVKSADSIPEIAQKVAKSFGTTWSSASEFVFDGHNKQLVATVLDKQSLTLAAKHFFASTQSAPLLQ
ncbi:MAG: hypothetical protein JWM99_4403 [Verrucomicrobiales bacterium]|nr:hypothetical protein [Verrucomicrobiales bacterium]